MGGATNKGFVGWWWTEEVSGEREEMLKGERKRMFESREYSLDEMVSWIREVIEELASHINRTCQR